MLSMDNVDRREEVFAETIELLGKDVAMIHFKDFLRQDADGQLKACGARAGRDGGLLHHPAFRKAGKALRLCYAGKYHPGKCRGVP